MTTPSHADDESPLHFRRGAAGVNRRQALALLAASAALANSACSAPPDERIYPYVDLPEARTSGLPLYYASAVVRDGHAHGVLVATKEGRPIKLEGNPLHPASLGATDAFTQAAVLQLWDPDRSASVRERLGRPIEGASAQTAASSWSAFETAWRLRTARSGADGGRALRLHVLTGPLTSPTERALLAALLQRHPGARWTVHAPVRGVAAVQGAQIAFGQAVAQLPQFEHARCVLGLAADPFSDGPGAVRHALDWSKARAAGRASGRLPLGFAAEVAPGLFGARAERRVALAPQRIERLLARIAAHWLPEQDAGTLAPAADAQEAAFERDVLQALRDAGSNALVLAGRGLSPAAHALALALNQRLGAIGRTLMLIEPPDAAPQAGTLAELVRSLNADEVDVLLVLDANPAYAAPAELDVRAAIARAKFSIHAGLYADETAALCDWHLPLSHDLERWGDARAHDGSATLLQPAIAPLHDSRSAAELLALLAGDELRDGHLLVQRQWRVGRSEAEFDAFWRDALRRGVVPGSAFAPVQPPPAQLAGLSSPPPEAAALVVLFPPDPSVHDGRFANIGWLQELPQPFTKLTWDNALQIGPRTAQALGVSTGDMVEARVAERTLVVAVWVLARHAEGAVTLTLGQGRTRAGQIGTGVGFDGFALRPVGDGPAPITLRRLDGRHAFAVTQHEMDQHGRELARTVEVGGRIDKPGTDHASLYEHDSYPKHAWGMTIDLDACIGCNACTIACQAENNIPVVGKAQVIAGREMHWIRIDHYDAPPEEGAAAGADDLTLFQPVPCMHCEKAPCELVCPVGATVHDSEGLNVQVYNRCVGTRFCSNNCPYKVRRFNFLQYSDETHETIAAQKNPDVTVRQRGVMEKCTYCLQRVTRARHHAEKTGTALVDGDVVTACQAVCPTRAIHFGDLNDATSDVARSKQSPRHYALLGELNTRPRTTYLARVLDSKQKKA